LDTAAGDSTAETRSEEEATVPDREAGTLALTRALSAASRLKRRPL
jgi:hypothetical protein